MRTHHAAALAVLLGLATPAAHAAAGDCPVNDHAVAGTVTPPPTPFEIWYTHHGALTDRDYFPRERAHEMGESYIPFIHHAYATPPFSFPAPSYTADPPFVTCIFFKPDNDAEAVSPRKLAFNAARQTDTREAFETLAHELFHFVQFAVIPYGSWPSWGEFQMEGLATAVTDDFETPGPSAYPQDVDTWADSRYMREVRNYLDDPNRTLFDLGYESALFWKYASEQLGGETAEPATGVDFVRRYYVETEALLPTALPIAALRNTIAYFDPEESLESLWRDFAITSYTHDFDVSALPDPERFRYFDETGAGGGLVSASENEDGVLEQHRFYGPVRTERLRPGATAGSSSVVRYGARYFEADLRELGVGACRAFGFQARAASGTRPAWALVGVKAPGEVTDLFRVRGDVFYGALVQPPRSPVYRRAALVAAGLGSSASFDYAFGSGPLSAEIRLPSADRPAFVGAPGGPGKRFQVRLRVTGPAALTPEGVGPVSVKGLDRSLFQVILRSVDEPSATHGAVVVSSSYVSGEYWLVVDAPRIDDPAEGTLFGVEICLCGRFPSCADTVKSEASVDYSEKRLNQVLVIDRSDSMNSPQPAENSKIAAARNAAALYASAANDGDRLGLVTFNGDDSECDDDSGSPFAGPLEVDASTRSEVRDAIELLGAGGLTSIGDGLARARDQVLSVSGSGDAEVLVLLSDGKENEGDFWSRPNAPCGTPPVRSAFLPGQPAAGVEIDTIAFGPGTNEELLQSIAGRTGGLFYPVSTDFPEPGHTVNPDPAELEVANRLAQTYRAIQERAQGQDRLFYASENLAPGASETVAVPITEKRGGGIRGAVFAITWNRAGAGVQPVLRDPHGQAVTAASPDWSIEDAASSRVYRYAAVLPAGEWTVRLSAARAAQALIMVSGELVQGVDLDVAFSQVRGKGPEPHCARFDYLYLRGLPVTVQARLDDARGPIRHASVEALVRNPDGSRNRLRLHDDGGHDDGPPGDGVYGGLYTRTPFFSNAGLPDLPPPPDPDAAPSGPWGSYAVQVTAAGRSNLGERFSRVQQGGFHVYEFHPNENPGCDPDADGDGLPDRWERLYGLDPSDPGDAHGDDDRDGLKNAEEFFRGTLPLDADSDGGGEADGSEVAAAQDGLYERDDRLPPMIDYGVVRRAGDIAGLALPVRGNLVRFPVDLAYRRMHIWRTDPGWSGFHRVASRDLTADRSPLYTDAPLQAGYTYRYFLVAEGESGVLSPPSAVFAGRPRDDPVIPEGRLVLDNGYGVSDSLQVTATWTRASGDALRMQLAETTELGSVPWQPFAAESPFTFSAPVSGSGPWTARLYARLRDSSGNYSEKFIVTVRIDADGDADGDGVPNGIDADDDGDGLPDQVELHVLRTNPFAADTDGDGIGDGQEDADQDLLTNLAEVNAGTDPLRNLADFDHDGAYGDADAEAFEQAWQAGDPAADVNGDGAVDDADAADFHAALEHIRTYLQD